MTYLIVTKFGVFRDQAVMQNKHVFMGHICTCAHADLTLFFISETAGLIALKFGVWLRTR